MPNGPTCRNCRVEMVKSFTEICNVWECPLCRRQIPRTRIAPESLHILTREKWGHADGGPRGNEERPH